MCQTQNIDSLVISLDADKTFDRVEWPYLLCILQKFDFGDSFLKCIKLLYNNPLASVITNRYRSDSVPFHRSTCQGCPRSPALFALAEEPLAEAIRKDAMIRGLRVENSL